MKALFADSRLFAFDHGGNTSIIRSKLLFYKKSGHCPLFLFQPEVLF
jgi:hypothetical protein